MKCDKHQLTTTNYCRSCRIQEFEAQCFTLPEIELLKQWFNSMEDTNFAYIEEGDRVLYAKITKALEKQDGN